MFLKKLFWIALIEFLIFFIFSSLSSAGYLPIQFSQPFTNLTPISMIWDAIEQEICIIGNAEDEFGEKYNLFWYFSKDGELLREKVIHQSIIGSTLKGAYLSSGKLILVSAQTMNYKKNSLPDTLVLTITTDSEQEIQIIATLNDIDLTFNKGLLIDAETEEILLLSGTHVALSRGKQQRNGLKIQIDCFNFVGKKVWTTLIGNQQDNVMGQLIKLNQYFYVLYSTWVKGERWNIRMATIDNFGEVISEKTILRGSGSDLISDIEKADNDHFILVGTTDSENNDWGLQRGDNDLIILKCDIDGNIKWSRRLGGQHCDIGIAVICDYHGMIWVAGMSESKGGDIPINHGGWDIWIIQLDQDGNILNNKCFGTLNDESPIQLLQAEKNVWLLGTTQVTATKTQPLLIRIND